MSNVNFEPGKWQIPKLSIVVPVTNMAGRLENLTSWVAEAIGLGVEVIIVHDFRDELTGRELRNILQNHSGSLSIILEGRYGSAGAARNAGLETAKGEWVSFWDSDDLPNVANVMRELLQVETEKTDVVVGNFSFLSATRKPLTFKHHNSMNRLAIFPGIWRYVFRHNFIKGLRFNTHRMGEDQIFLSNIFILDPRVYFSSSILYRYFVGMEYQATAKGISKLEALGTLETSIEIFSKHPEKLVSYHYVLFCNQLLTFLGKSINLKNDPKRKELLKIVSAVVPHKRIFLYLILEKIAFKLRWFQWKVGSGELALKRNHQSND